MGKNVLLLYTNQLFDLDALPKDVDQVIMVEEPLIFGKDNQYPRYLHRQKLVYMRASARRYVEEVLWPAGYKVEYIESHRINETGDIVNKLHEFDEIIYFDVTDDVLQRRLESAIDGLSHSPEVEVLESPNFFLSRQEITNFLTNTKKANFNHFYRWQRERFNILINPDTYKPVGGKLSFDSKVSKRLPLDHKIPSFQVFGSNKYVEEAKKYVTQYFPENPGRIDDFAWPTNSEESYQWLKEFLEHRIDSFNDYEDAVDGNSPWVYHSGISPMLNNGLLSPQKVIDLALQRNKKKSVPIASLESFIRHILGWREYMRGQYLKKHVQMRTANIFGHNRTLTADWYNGTTGIPPVDDVINKILDRSYIHHVERLMVIGNIMFLSDIHPDEVYRWFMEMCIDSYDWVTVPNVYIMSQFADGGSSLIEKPFISSSNYIQKMSHYSHGDWSDTWDGLYWRFIDKNRERFSKNSHMSSAVKQLDRVSEEHRRISAYRAEDFLSKKTGL